MPVIVTLCGKRTRTQGNLCPMSFRAGVLCYPWDLLDDGLDAALECIQGTLGATGITLVVASPPKALLRRGSDGTLRMIRTGGGLWFPPDGARYASTRCQPVVSDQAKGRNVLRPVIDACRKRGLGLRLAIAATVLGRMAERHPFAAVRNILDDVSTTRLCLSNPDVGEFLRGLVGELSRNYEPEVVELRDFDRGRAGDATAGIECSVEVGPVGDGLLSLCGCESCRQAAAAAGVDVEAAMRSADVTLRRVFEDRTDRGSFADLLAADTPLREYVEVQGRVLADLLGSLRACGRDRLVLHRRGDEIAGSGELASLSRHVQAVKLAVPSVAGEPMAATLQAARTACGPPCRVELELAADIVARHGPPALVAALKEAVTSDVTSVDIAGLASRGTPLDDAVKQGIRYARRTFGS
jgi:hypothetical protein